MSARIETLGTRARTPHPAWLVVIAALLAFVAVVTLSSRIAPDTTISVRPPAVATTLDSAPGASTKAVANDPYVRMTPSLSPTRGMNIEATRATVDELGFGPNFNMGRACPKCW